MTVGAGAARDAMRDTKRFFRAAGYVFTVGGATRESTTRLEMWREDPVTRVRYWVTMAPCRPGRPAAYARALALVAWVRSLGVSPRKEVQAQAVAESLAITHDRVLRARSRPDPAMVLALDRLLAGQAAAA